MGDFAWCHGCNGQTSARDRTVIL